MPDEEGPKIIIDEDWKSQVEREKREAEAAKASEPHDSKAKEKPVRAPFDDLVSYVATHAMAALGMFAPEDAEEVPVNLEAALFLINGLIALRQKAKGNLSPEEEGRLTSLVADLQRSFVACSQAVHASVLDPTGPGDSILTP